MRCGRNLSTPRTCVWRDADSSWHQRSPGLRGLRSGAAPAPACTAATAMPARPPFGAPETAGMPAASPTRPGAAPARWWTGTALPGRRSPAPPSGTPPATRRAAAPPSSAACPPYPPPHARGIAARRHRRGPLPRRQRRSSSLRCGRSTLTPHSPAAVNRSYRPMPAPCHPPAQALPRARALQPSLTSRWLFRAVLAGGPRRVRVSGENCRNRRLPCTSLASFTAALAGEEVMLTILSRTPGGAPSAYGAITGCNCPGVEAHHAYEFAQRSTVATGYWRR